MITLIHVLIALSSIGIATITLFQPSKKIFTASYTGIVATLVSGIYLVVVSPSQMVHACVSGVIYLSIVTLVTIAARVKFAKLIHQPVEAE